MTKTKKSIFLTMLAVLMSPVAANAVPINESGDATDLMPGQSVADGTTSIIGTLSGTDITDLFGFTWGGGILTIDTIGSVFDTQLHLFDGAGFGIAENDDGNGLDLLSEISLNLGSGLYFLAITGWNNDALDAANLPIFGFSNTFNDLGGNLIQGPEGNGSLAGWDGNSSLASGSYVINFSAAVNSTTVPEPGTLALFGIGLFAMGFSRRRKTA